ncbi:MAG TPA: GNAT family N-acetyltransferase [Herpetosiphonaceae bacterium]|nr:GNAT family N-acetyltransferase [Herpetosiphonaceae bacterium]
MPEPLGLRPISPADAAFLTQVYGSTREEELAQVEWQPGQKQAFIEMQFAAQHAHYQQHYRDAMFAIIEHGGEAAGRLYLARWAGEYRIVDIALLPQFRGKGLGSIILNAIINEAAAHGLPVSIHVERFNPALRLYERLGFKFVSEYGVYYLMRRPINEETNARNSVD